MPWYIRFAKVPELFSTSASSSSYGTKKASKPDISTSSEAHSPPSLAFSFEIRNDLGESLFPASLDVLVSVLCDSGEGHTLPLLRSSAPWVPSKWVTNVSLQLPPTRVSKRASSQQRLRVHLSVGDNVVSSTGNQLSVPECSDLSYIYSTTSSWMPLVAGTRAEPFALRPLPGGLELWEGTGRSIASHVWDAGVIMCAHVCHLAEQCRQKQLQGIHELAKMLFQGSDGEKSMNVLELGSGCGITGLVLAQQFPNCQVELTDVEEAMELLHRNTEEAERTLSGSKSLKDHEKMSASSLCYALNWESQQDCETATKRVKHRDVVLVSDCTYNVDMVEHLVGALAQVSTSSSTLVVVALKRRHEDEERFFDEMHAKHFRHVQKYVLKMTSSEVEEMHGLEPRDIELHFFRHNQLP